MQLEACRDLDLFVVVFTNDSLRNSNKFIFWKHKLFKLESSFLRRFFQVFNYLKKHKNSIHHVEVYPGGRYIYIYLLLIKYFKLKSICVERGELIFWKNRNYIYKLLLKLVYKGTDIVWYRELYMEKILFTIGVKKMFYLHNCCNIPEIKSTSAKSVDFLWVNRVTKERKAGWFLESMGAYKNTKNIIVGDIGNLLKIKHSHLKLINFKIFGYENPTPFYLKSKFFVLPSEVVYANNSLLEAMSFGLVPLVSKVLGSDQIVNHLENGYIFDHTLTGFQKAIKWAISLNDEMYSDLSRNATNKIAKDFSYQKWKDNYNELILSFE